MREISFSTPLVGPLETIREQSAAKGKLIAACLIAGHPLYHLCWTRLDLQPYDSFAWRLLASLMGACSLIALLRLGPGHRATRWIFEFAMAFGTVVLASWHYVANGGNAAWLASLAAMTMLYFGLTDWRVATVVTALSWAAASLLVPLLGVGVYAAGGNFPDFDLTAWLILGFVVVVSIVTRYADTSLRIVRMLAQMHAIGVVAHEVRTPLAGMQLLATALRDRLGDGPHDEAARADAAQLARDLLQTCEEADVLVQTHLANANPFRPFAARALVDVAELAHDTARMFERGAGLGRFLVEVRVLRNFCVLADRGALQQALVNLLRNALRAVVLRHLALAPGQIEVQVDFDGEGRVCVVDRGIGIASKDIARIFEPFHTGDPQHGHGLGLTYVRSAVQAYGGAVRVQAVEGGGTRMVMAFPEGAAA